MPASGISKDQQQKQEILKIYNEISGEIAETHHLLKEPLEIQRDILQDGRIFRSKMRALRADGETSSNPSA